MGKKHKREKKKGGGRVLKGIENILKKVCTWHAYTPKEYIKPLNRIN